MIGVIDYGMGNLFSVSKALERLGVDYIVSEDPNELKKADGLLLPGVGAFNDAIKLLKSSGLMDFVKEAVENETPLLGICLGMQLLFESSEENGYEEGFGFLPGRAIRFPGVTNSGETYKVPHMGWNKLTLHQPESPLLKGVDGGYVYFVHSYYIDTTDQDVLIATSQYDVMVPAIVGRGKVYGTQFHPEKSGTLGMAILDRFVRNVVLKGE